MLTAVDAVPASRTTQLTPEGLPAPPRTIEETGLSMPFLVELHAKVLCLRGESRLAQLAQHLKLPLSLVEAVLEFMRVEKITEVKRRGGTDGDVHYTLTDNGRVRAVEFLQKSQYAGAAPVSLEAYTRQVQRQAIANMRVTLEDVDRAFEGLVIRTHLREQLGAAMNSGRPMFLYGPAGSGKTFLAEQLLRLLNGAVAVPYAICVDNEVIQVYDPLIHHPRGQDVANVSAIDRRQAVDARWVLCERPVSIAGGELTMEMLNLEFDQTSRFYQAPPHVKANNGLFIIDDLGRQLISPQQLMNRWIVPMDRRRDYQALHNGYKFAIPFDVILVFSTNLMPSQVADEAFLRRLGYKIHVGPVERGDYRSIFMSVCEEHGIEYSEDAFDYLLREHHEASGKPLLACYPRDLIGQIRDFAQYRGMKAELTQQALDWAWGNYFASH
ncbi:MAG: AAA family ATPase [Rhodospirillaceae bacterium]